MSAVLFKKHTKILIKLKFKLCVCIIKLKFKVTASDDDFNAPHCKLTWSKCRESVSAAVKFCIIIKKKVNLKPSKKDVLNESSISADWEVLELFLTKCKYTHNEPLLSDTSSALALFFKKSAEFVFSSSVEHSASVKSAFEFRDEFFSLLKSDSVSNSDQLTHKCKHHNELLSHMTNKCRTKCKMNQTVKKKQRQIIKHLFKDQVHDKFIDKNEKMYWKMSHTLLNSIKHLHVELFNNFTSAFFTASSHFNSSDMSNLNNELMNL